MKTRNFLEFVLFLIAIAVVTVLLRPKAAILLNNKALEYTEQGQLNRALDLLTLAVRLKDDPKLHDHMARIYEEKQDFALAIVEYQKAVELDPKDTKAYLGLARLHRQAKMFKEALGDINKAMPLDPTQAQQELRKTNVEYAIFLYNEASDYYYRNDIPRALLKLKEVLEVEPSFVLAYQSLGDIASQQNFPERALVYYEQVVALGSKDPMVLNNIGICYMRMENYPMAVSYLRRACALAPGEAFILYSLASTLRDHKQKAEALEQYRKLAVLQYDFPGVHNDIAHLYEDMGRREEARAEFRKEAELCRKRLLVNPQDQASLLFLAAAHNGLQEYAEALSAVKIVLALNPRSGEAIYARGLIFEKMGRFSEALRDFETAKGFFLRHSFIEEDIARVKRSSRK